MLPLVDSVVLNNNPRFAALYHDLTKNKLTAGGASTLDAKAAKESESLKDALWQARIYACKRDLVASSLDESTRGVESLAAELHEQIDIAISLLDGRIPLDDVELIRDDVESFKSNLDRIAPVLSRKLRQDAMTLSEVIFNDSQNGIVSDEVMRLQKTIAQDTAATNRLQSERPARMGSIQQLHRQITETCIRVLEQVMHGSASRATKAEADYLACVAEGMVKKLEMQQRQLTSQIDSDAVRIMIKAKLGELNQQYSKIRKECQAREEVLAELERGVSL